jgi:hypothetical protein
MVTVFNSSDVKQFLINTNNGFLACCWYNDMVLDRPEYTSYMAALKWFKRHLNNDYLFHLMTHKVPGRPLSEQSDKYSR